MFKYLSLLGILLILTTMYVTELKKKTKRKPNLKHHMPENGIHVYKNWSFMELTPWLRALAASE